MFLSVIVLFFLIFSVAGLRRLFLTCFKSIVFIASLLFALLRQGAHFGLLLLYCLKTWISSPSTYAIQGIILLVAFLGLSRVSAPIILAILASDIKRHLNSKIKSYIRVLYIPRLSHPTALINPQLVEKHGMLLIYRCSHATMVWQGLSILFSSLTSTPEIQAPHIQHHYSTYWHIWS